MTSKKLLSGFALTLSIIGAQACGGEVSEAEVLDTSTDELRLQLQTSNLTPTDDARIQAGSGDVNFGSAQLWINTEASHYSLLKFDLNALPPGATIESARLVLRHVPSNIGTARTIELGAVGATWQEDTLTWNNMPAISWGGPTAVVSGVEATNVEWDVTGMAQDWYSGSRPNEGFGLRGQGNGPGKLFHSKDTSAEYAPRLVIEYTAPIVVGPRPDLGGAPDSTNHHGVVNWAYPGVPGQFPTVWTAGLPSGPRHANPTVWGLLGQGISSELEADLLPDSDGPANILLNAAGALSPFFRNNDRADDGWLNPNRMFFNCQRETLDVRVGRASNQQGVMYLNAWFDGVHDGDWDDVGPCTPPGGGAAQPSYEWILQNQPINMNAIPAGGFSDLSFTTERVLNTSLWARHWVRFTLSEQPAVVPPAGLPDGRGRPHPADPNGFTYGETEDFLHFIPQGEPGKIVIDKQVQTGTDPLNFAGTATYQIKVRHEGGTAPAQAIIRDLLPLPLNEMHIIGSVDVSTNGNGAAPLVAAIGIEPNEFKHGVTWEGVLAPNSEITLEFPVHVHVDCLAFQSKKAVTNVARVQSGGQQFTDDATFNADCPGGLTPVPVETLIDVNSLPRFYP
jgi:hypothetical protein